MLKSDGVVEGGTGEMKKQEADKNEENVDAKNLEVAVAETEKEEIDAIDKNENKGE